VPGVDVWLGGHSHARVSGEAAGVPALVPGSHGEVIGVCDLVVDPLRQRVVEARRQLVATWADEMPPDSAIGALVERWSQVVAPLANARIGRNARRLTRGGGGDSPIASLVADVIRGAAEAEIGLQNNGGVRADLPEGEITRGAVYEILPFANTIVTLELTGAEVRRVLEEGLANERITRVSGIRYRFDPGAPAGARVTSLLGADGQPLQESRTYRVACDDFMVEGGYGTLGHGRALHDTGKSSREALEDFIRRTCADGGALEFKEDGRVTREPGSRPAAREE
jgi:2',3'-cyclic-nucleotide 2'-phosphodiesterase (5'-nucleotidase family)